MQWHIYYDLIIRETNIVVRGLHRYMDSTTYRPIAISSFARERGLVPSFAFYEYFRQREKRRKKRGSSEGGEGIRGSRVDDRVIPRRRASPRRAAGGNRNGIGKPFGASLIDDLVPRKKGPPIKGRISTQRWDRDAWVASKLAFKLLPTYSISIRHRVELCGFSGARKAKIVLRSLVEVSLPETKTDMEAGSEEEGAQV